MVRGKLPIPSFSAKAEIQKYSHPRMDPRVAAIPPETTSKTSHTLNGWQ